MTNVKAKKVGKKSSKKKRVVQKRKHGEKGTTSRQKKQAKGKTSKRAKSGIKAQKRSIKKNLYEEISKEDDTLKTKKIDKVSKKDDSLRKVMLESLEKDTLKEERDMTPREETRVEKVGVAISSVEKIYTKSRETTSTTIDFSGNVAKGTFKLVATIVGESLHILGLGILGIVTITGKGYRRISKIAPREKKIVE
ncbi:MAG: hypothetical protein JYX80_12660 [Candidatus Scalindua sediminis]|nr:hypothetical protein [Candidatus Scalindua sediminis]HDY67712.1 hypothetical protein [Candidatus Scalindua sp.]